MCVDDFSAESVTFREGQAFPFDAAFVNVLRMVVWHGRRYIDGCGDGTLSRPSLRSSSIVLNQMYNIVGEGIGCDGRVGCRGRDSLGLDRPVPRLV